MQMGMTCACTLMRDNHDHGHSLFLSEARGAAPHARLGVDRIQGGSRGMVQAPEVLEALDSLVDWRSIQVIRCNPS